MIYCYVICFCLICLHNKRKRTIIFRTRRWVREIENKINIEKIILTWICWQQRHNSMHATSNKMARYSRNNLYCCAYSNNARLGRINSSNTKDIIFDDRRLCQWRWRSLFSLMTMEEYIWQLNQGAYLCDTTDTIRNIDITVHVRQWNKEKWTTFPVDALIVMIRWMIFLVIGGQYLWWWSTLFAHMTMKEYLWLLNQVVHLYDGNVYALHTLKKKCLGWFL